jgi:hypothetical protein
MVAPMSWEPRHCSCDTELTPVALLDGGIHYTYRVPWLRLLKCTRCGTWWLYRWWCSKEDFTGDHDEYSESCEPISLPDLAALLVKLDTAFVLASWEGRHFTSSRDKAQEIGDPVLIDLVEAALRARGSSAR